MPDAVMGGAALPPINLLSMILEGPKGYFGRRGQMSDQLWLQNQAQQQRGAFADSLLASPVYKQALANPTDRAAQYSLWALGQHGPAAIADEAGSWLQAQLGAANQQAAQAQAFANQQQALKLEDTLQRGRISFSTDEQLRQYQAQKQFDLQQTMNNLKLINATDPATGQPMFSQQQQQDMTYNFIQKTIGGKELPDGYSVGRDQTTGNTFFTPTVGGDVWQKSMDELAPIQMNQGAIAQLQDMLDGKVQWSRPVMQSLIQTIQDNIRKQGGFGSLDAGTAEAMNNYITQVGKVSQYNPASEFTLTARESLRALALKQQEQAQNWSRKWRIDPANPAVGDPYKYTTPAVPPPPKGAADAAVPAPREKGTVGAGGSVNAPNLLGDPAATAKKSREQFQRDKEALKKKFPGAGVR